MPTYRVELTAPATVSRIVTIKTDRAAGARALRAALGDEELRAICHPETDWEIKDVGQPNDAHELKSDAPEQQPQEHPHPHRPDEIQTTSDSPAPPDLGGTQENAPPPVAAPALEPAAETPEPPQPAAPGAETPVVDPP